MPILLEQKQKKSFLSLHSINDKPIHLEFLQENEKGFQIFIAAFDEPGPITKERILKDIPDMVISNEKEILVGGERALSFTSQDDLGNETQETWLVHSGNLYQISVFPSFEKELLEILKTWKFQ